MNKKIMSTLAYYTITICWLLLVVFWIVSALRLKPVAERQTARDYLKYKLLTLLGALLLWRSDLCPGLNLRWYPRPEGLYLVAAIVCVAGLGVAIWSRATLAGNWSSDVTFKQNHELIQSGPYRWVRHPIYTGILLMALATALAGGRIAAWVGLLVMAAGFWIKLKHEEALMLRHFPGNYPAYKNRVKALIPFVL